MANNYLSPEEAAARLGIKPDTVRKWCREGKLPCVKLGRLWRIRESDFSKLEGFMGE